MKFSKGDYIVGEDSTFEIGTVVTANLDEMLAGWIQWKKASRRAAHGAYLGRCETATAR